MSNTRRASAGVPVPSRAAALLATSLALGACSTPGADVPDDGVRAEELRVVRYAIVRGDRLSAIARDFTGDEGLWRTIADLNGIADPRRLAVGQILEIPAALIPETEREARLAASVPLGAETDADGDADNAATRLAELRERTVAAPTSGDASGTASDAPARPSAGTPAVAGPGRAVQLPSEPASEPASEPVVVSAVRTREAFERSPIDETTIVGAAGSRSVKVIGSYTPKGVYERPEGDSRVIMRITPGTVLPLERTVEGWYQVLTSAGPGYLRDRDAEEIGTAER